eukprot:122934-Prorocentrum_lima.AAC.1
MGVHVDVPGRERGCIKHLGNLPLNTSFAKSPPLRPMPTRIVRRKEKWSEDAMDSPCTGHDK